VTTLVVGGLAVLSPAPAHGRLLRLSPAGEVDGSIRRQLEAALGARPGPRGQRERLVPPPHL